jgi:hypothetical protein
LSDNEFSKVAVMLVRLNDVISLLSLFYAGFCISCCWLGDEWIFLLLVSGKSVFPAKIYFDVISSILNLVCL